MRKNIYSGLTTILISSLAVLVACPRCPGKGPSDRDPLAEIALSNDTLQLRYYDKKDSDADSRLVAADFSARSATSY